MPKAHRVVQLRVGNGLASAQVTCKFQSRPAESDDLLPEPVRIFLALHQKYLTEDSNLRRVFESVYRELRRALRITPSSAIGRET